MNPIIRRELLEVLRTRKALALQFTLAVACALMVLIRWPTGDIADLNGARSLQVLRIFGYGLLAAILLLVPAFPATSLVRERVKGTLALLLNSPMRPWSIYLGKLGGVLGFAAVLLVMTLPAAAACNALGGTTVQGGMLALYAVLALAIIQLATLGLLVSSRSLSTDGALRVTYALVLVVCVLTLAPYALLRAQEGFFKEAASWLQCLSPIPALMEVLGQGDVGSQGFSGAASAPLRYLILATLFSVACAIATVAQLRPVLLDRARPPGVMTEDRSAAGQGFRRVWFLGFFDPQRRSGSLSHWINPVMVKEFRSRRFGRLHWILRLIALSALLSLGLSVMAATNALTWGVDVIGGILVLLQIALLILFAPSLAAGLVAGERESGSWQLLRMTPLSAFSIVTGKLLSVAGPLLLLLLAALPGYVVMMTIDATQIYHVQRVVICLVLTGVFAVLLSAALSTMFRSTAAATTASYLALLAFCMGPFLIWLAQDAPFGRATVEAVLTVNPVAAALQAAASPGFKDYELLPANWIIIGTACLVLAGVLGMRTWQLCRPD